MSTHFCSPDYVRQFFFGKTVAIVGSGPGALDNEPGFVDSHEIVVRVNNFGLGGALGERCDVHYSYFGNAIKKTREELQACGVRLVMCKCPDAAFVESEWHRRRNKMHGVDFRWIYELRRDFWFCPTYVPPHAELKELFDALGGHIPTTGFSALMAIAECEPASVYLTGFDFFSSKVHNVREPWRPGNPDDPIGHVPDRERALLKAALEADPVPLTFDPRLTKIMKEE